jgi:hypothetical protein
MTFELKTDAGANIQLHASNGEVAFMQEGYGHAMMSPSEARQVAEALTAAADEAEKPAEAAPAPQEVPAAAPEAAPEAEPEA